MSQLKVWNEIAKDWNNFRQRPFPNIVNKVAERWKPGRILDVGCGNCRNTLPFAKRGFSCYAIDFSENMIGFARKYCDKNKIRVNIREARAEYLPFRKESFDYCINIASFHHLQDTKTRKEALSEIYRVLKPKGKLLIVVWNKLQIRFLFKPKNNYVNWRTKGKNNLRYYYLFSHWELKKLLEEFHFKIIHSEGFFSRNLIFIAQKPDEVRSKSLF